MKQIIIKIVLALVIILLAYLVIDSIMKPVEFSKEKERREKVVIDRLKDIRNAQLLYKTQNDKYASNWDTLTDFLKVTEIPITKRESYVFKDISDTTGATLFNEVVSKKFRNYNAILRFLKSGTPDNIDFYEDTEDKSVTVTVTTVIDYKNAVDSLFKQEGFDVNQLRFIPYSDGKIFEIEAGTIEKGQVKVPVFEVKARYEDILKDMNKQLVINLVAKRDQLELYPGILVGSMLEPSTDGNWEN